MFDRAKLILTATQIITNGCLGVWRADSKQFKACETSSLPGRLGAAG